MYVERLKSLLAEGGVAPANADRLAHLCDQWFMEQPRVAVYVLWHLLDGFARNCDDEQGCPTSEYLPFHQKLLPVLTSVVDQLSVANDQQIQPALDNLLRTYRECRIAANKVVSP